LNNVKLVTVTPDAENLISYCARVSNPTNQNNTETAPKLLGYLIKNKHWSPFEMANMVVEIKTTRAVAAQILRHRSFSFQEFSQRYAETSEMVVCEARRQDLKNRQNSVDDFPKVVKDWFEAAQYQIWDQSYALYKDALDKGIAKECARFLLPLNSSTTIYMNGSIRSWVHYCLLRSEKGTQLEHREISDSIWKIIREELPNLAKAVEDINIYMKDIK
jgi:thymidylate synthase (FAD)